MSKTIEFIEQATIANQRRLEQYKKDLEYYLKDFSLVNYVTRIFLLKHNIAHIEKIVLPNLQQIKVELEAWEVVKDKTMGNDYLYEIVIYKSEKDDYKKFEKALEAKGNG